MLSKFLFILRLLLAIGAALLLLVSFSYPDAIIPPRYLFDPAPGFTEQDLRPFIWLAPLLLLEFISILGKRRNVVWFSSLLAVLAVALLAWPVLTATYPELVHPTIPEYEDGKLATGLVRYSILLLFSLVFRLVMLRYFFPEPLKEYNDAGAVEATVLNPATARTVYEIASDRRQVKPHFLFGEADQGLIARFRSLLRHMSIRKRILTGSGILLLLLGIVWFFFYPQPSEHEAFERDLARMYHHHSHQEGFRACPSALPAAYRACRYIVEQGLLDSRTPEEAARILRLDTIPAAYRQFITEQAGELSHITNYDTHLVRVLTIPDARGRRVTLFARTNEDTSLYNIAEMEEEGWNHIIDVSRGRAGSNVHRALFD